MSDESPTWVRICYVLGGEVKTLWTKETTHKVRGDGMLEAMNVETGERKVLSPNTPWSITVGVELPPNVEGSEVITDE